MFKFIHAADIHLDSPLRGLAQYDGAPVKEIRGATRKALINLVELALEEAVDFVLIAGDVYDGDWKDHNTGLYFGRQMARLKAANIPVFLIAGNHDAQSVMTRSLRLPDNVHRFSTEKAETVQLEMLGVAIHGQGFETKSVSKDLSAKYPRPLSGAYNIALLHTSLTGYEGHDDYAPCTVAGLTRLGYDYWALGHIHGMHPVIDDKDSVPNIWYPGCIQGRHIRETGPKGCLLVEVDDRGDHNVDFRSLDVLRWETIEVDASTCSDVNACVDLFSLRLADAMEEAGDRFLAVRVLLVGKTEIHDALVAESESLQLELRNAANINGAERVWVEKVKVRTRPVEPEGGVNFDDGPLAVLHEVVAAMKSDGIARERLTELLKPLQDKLPLELRTGDDSLDFSEASILTAFLDDAEPSIRSAWRNMEAGQ